MTKPEKAIRQPLGSSKSLQKIMETLPAEQTLEQTRVLRIIYAKRKLQVDIPMHWTINKVKCMMCTHFDILNFDKFEFQCNKMLIPGNTLVANLPDDQLIVTQADCPKALSIYYKKAMKKVLKKYNINTQSTIFPITDKAFTYNMLLNMPKQRQQNIERTQLDENRRENDQNQGAIVINIFRVIGIALLTNIVFSFASYMQIGILVFIACLYYLIDEHVRDNDRRRRNAERQAQRLQQEENRRRQEQRKLEELNKQRGQNKAKTSSQLAEQKKKALMDIMKKSTEDFHNRNKQNDQNSLHFDQAQKEQLIQALKQEKEIKFNQAQTVHETKQNKETDNQLQKQQPENEIQMAQQPQRKNLKAKLKLWTAFIIEAFYCYILSIFPNWTVATHLHANQQIMDNLMNQVKQLDPQASQQVKKWEIKEKKPEPKIQEEQIPKIE